MTCKYDRKKLPVTLKDTEKGGVTMQSRSKAIPCRQPGRGHNYNMTKPRNVEGRKCFAKNVANFCSNILASGARKKDLKTD